MTLAVTGLRSFTGTIVSYAARAAAAAGVTLGFAAALGALKERAAVIDELAKGSARLGIGVQALLTLQHAATLSGSSAETLNTALEKMSRNLGQAALGTGQAKRALDALGLDVYQLISMSPDEAFIAISQAITKVKNPTLEASHASDIMGRSAIELLNTIHALGEGGFAELTAEVKRLHPELSGPALQAVQDMNDAFSRLTLAGAGLLDSVLTKMAPTITKIVDQVIEFVVWLQHLDVASLKNTVQFLAFVGALAAALVLVPRIISAFFAIIKALRSMAQAQAIVQALSGPGGWITLGIGLAVGAAAAYGIGAAFDSFTASATAASTEAKKAAAATDTAAAASLRKAAADKAAAAAHKKLMEEGERLTKSLRSPIEKLNDDLTHLRELQSAGAIGWETFRRAIAKTVDEYDRATEAKHSFDVAQKKQVGAVVRGTTAAFAAVVDARSAQASAEEAERRAAERDEKRDKLLERIAKGVEAPSEAAVEVSI